MKKKRGGYYGLIVMAIFFILDYTWEMFLPH